MSKILQNIPNNSVSSVQKVLNQMLSKIYSVQEAERISEMMLEDVLGFSRLDLITKKDTRISESELNKTEAIAKRLRNNEPIQYCVGLHFFL